MSKEKKFKPRRSGLDTAITAVLVVILIAVLGLSVYSIAGKIKENMPVQMSANPTVQEVAEQASMTVDEFKTEFGLPADVTGETYMFHAEGMMNCGNYAKYIGTTFEEFISYFQLPETVTEETNYTDAIDLTTVAIMAGGEDNVESFKETYGLDASVTGATPYGEVREIVEAIHFSQLVAAEEAENSEANDEVEAETSVDVVTE